MFGKKYREDGPIILTLETLFMSLIGQGCISMVFIELLEIEETFIKCSCVGK
jgi:hypothetical protein